MTLLKRLLREPLVHFLLLGGLLFLYFGWRGGSGLGSSRIAITPGLIEHLGQIKNRRISVLVCVPKMLDVLRDHGRADRARGG